MYLSGHTVINRKGFEGKHQLDLYCDVSIHLVTLVTMLGVFAVNYFSCFHLQNLCSVVLKLVHSSSAHYKYLH